MRAARWLHLTGITPALGIGSRAVVERSLAEATSAEARVSFDVNYRAKLWSPAEAAQGLAPLLAHVTVLICSLRDGVTLFGLPQEAEDAVVVLHERFRPGVTVLTVGEQGALAYDGMLRRQPALRAQTIDPLGSGDAFAAGFIAGYLEDGVPRGLAFGAALAALKRTYRGDLAWCTRQQLLAVLEQGGDTTVRR